MHACRRIIDFIKAIIISGVHSWLYNYIIIYSCMRAGRSILGDDMHACMHGVYIYFYCMAIIITVYTGAPKTLLQYWTACMHGAPKTLYCSTLLGHLKPYCSADCTLGC